ncbi:hypothetical protein ABZP36_007191 [Zizania latifolia]
MCRLGPECKGSGEIMSDRDKCTNCRASKVVQEKKVLVVHIEKGMQHGHKNTRLHYKVKLMKQGAVWFQFILTHLDSRQILIKSNPGGIMKPGQHKAINDDDMPHHGLPFMKDHLFVEFNVEFPESGVLSRDQQRALEKILPPKPGNQLSDMDLD